MLREQGSRADMVIQSPGRRSLLAIAVTGVMVCAFGTEAGAQSFPDRPVKIVTPFSAGAGPDVVLRLLANKLSRSWGQPVIIENKPGGSGILAAEAVKRAPADGYTLVQMDSAQLTALPHMMSKLPYDVKRDFDPIATQYQVYFFVAVPAKSPWKGVGDLIAEAKRKPGSLNYGSWYVGSPGHLGGVQLETAAQLRMLHVPYKEMGQLYAAVATGEVDWALASAASAGQLYQAGKLRFLAVAAPKRLQGFEQVPTVAESRGPKDYEAGGWVAIMAPHGVPAAIAEKLNSDISRFTQEPDMRERLRGFGFESYVSTPADLAKRIQDDSRKQAVVIKGAGISLD